MKYQLEFSNERQKVELSVEKQDAETGKALKGATFGLYNKEAISSGDKVIVKADTLLQEITSNEKGKAAFPCFRWMLRRNIFYTAVTRARERFIIVGSKRAIAQAIRTDYISRRNTMFGYRIRKIYEAILEQEKSA